MHSESLVSPYHGETLSQQGNTSRVDQEDPDSNLVVDFDRDHGERLYFARLDPRHGDNPLKKPRLRRCSLLAYITQSAGRACAPESARRAVAYGAF